MGWWFWFALAAWALLVPESAVAGGVWRALANTAPDSVGLTILLPDGTIMAANNPTSSSDAIGNDWYSLTPDHYGHYEDGEWARRASANYARLFFSSQVLQNGSVFVAGGEYGGGSSTDIPTAEVYNPLINPGSGSWTVINPPSALLNSSQGIGDAESKLLPNGSVLIAPVNPGVNNGTLIYNPNSNGWSQGPPSLNPQLEVSWVKLPDGSILSVDPLGGFTGEPGTNSERYIPSLSPPQWVPDANLPVELWANLTSAVPPLVGEIGPAFLLPNGKAFFLGGTGHTAIYTPSPLGGTNNGSWVAGPDIPQGLVSADAPGAMMPNGKILFSAAQPMFVNTSGTAVFNNPASFFEYDYSDLTQGPTGSYAQVNGPTGQTDNIDTYQSAMLVLPDGRVLYCHFEQGNLFYSSFGSQLYIYQPDGSPVASGKPVINSVVPNPDGSFHLAGTGLNGISAGAAYGDDAQMDSNYPLVAFANLSDGTGHVDYGRTYNWSSTGVMTGTTPVTTEFVLPQYLIPDTYALTVIANGISSDAVTFVAPVWVDFNYPSGGAQNGSFTFPFDTIAQGVSAVSSGGTIFIKTSGHSPETLTISQPMTIAAVGGPATIGN
jgi:hypothetical protein